MKVLNPKDVLSDNLKNNRLIAITEFESFEEFCSICDPRFISQKGKQRIWFGGGMKIDQRYPKSIYSLIKLKEDTTNVFLETFNGVDHPINELNKLNDFRGKGFKGVTIEGDLFYIPSILQDTAKYVLFFPKVYGLENEVGYVINRTTSLLPNDFFYRPEKIGESTMRIKYLGTEYVLAKSTTNIPIASMEHIGSFSRLQLPYTTTPQLYKDTDKNGESTLYLTAVVGNSVYINWVKRLVPISQVEELIGELI